MIRALFGLCDTEAGAKEVASMGAAIILHPLLNSVYQPLRNAAFECLSRILVVPGYQYSFGEELAGHDASDKVIQRASPAFVYRPSMRASNKTLSITTLSIASSKSSTRLHRLSHVRAAPISIRLSGLRKQIDTFICFCLCKQCRF